MTFGFDKCFAVVFNSRTKKTEALPTFTFGGSKPSPNLLPSFYPKDAPAPYLGVIITDYVAQTKIDNAYKLPYSLVPNYRRKPNSRYLKLIKSKFLRARHATFQLCSNKATLTPSISIRLYKTFQRSTLLYAIELVDWDVDQIKELETLQAKALRTCLNSDLQCPQALIRLFSGVEPIEARRDLHTLLYFGKLCRYGTASFPSIIHRMRISKNFNPVGFHRTVLRILKKYGIEKYWEYIPDAPSQKLKATIKKPIWLYHWNKDVATARSRDSPFSAIFLKNVQVPNYPYKTYHFLNIFNTLELPRNELTSILRFWTTPCRERICSCTRSTCNLAKHLIFTCPKYRELVACYRRKLLPGLRLLLLPNSFNLFLSRISSSTIDFFCFNRVVGKFDYPQY